MNGLKLSPYSIVFCRETKLAEQCYVIQKAHRFTLLPTRAVTMTEGKNVSPFLGFMEYLLLNFQMSYFNLITQE